jgi:Cysteine-rich CWC
MCQHETKNCPRCDIPFECKPGNITHCQCYSIVFNPEEKAFIEQRYNDCLCKACLLQLKDQVELFKEKFIYGKR